MTMLDGERVEALSETPTSAIIFLHGYGANGADLIGLAQPLAEHLPETVFFAPNAPERCVNNPMGFQWFPIPWLDGSSEAAMALSFGKSAAALSAYLDEVEGSTGVGPERVALVGFSQGTMMSLHVGLRRSVACAGIVGFSGRLMQPERRWTRSPCARLFCWSMGRWTRWCHFRIWRPPARGLLPLVWRLRLTPRPGLVTA